MFRTLTCSRSVDTAPEKFPHGSSKRYALSPRCGAEPSPSLSGAPWHESLTERSRHNVAQIGFDAECGNWSPYWRDRNGRWHLFDLIEPGIVD
ncbi:MAG: DUF3024 domain-containing protein [Acidimicrobiales bacterium]